MRFVTVATVLALTLSAGAALAAEETLSPEAQAGIDIAKQYARTDKLKFRKVKVGADGNVCGKVSVGADRDIEFMVNPTDQTLWLNEGSQEAQSDFGLAALRNLASLSASLVIGLSALAEDADPKALWDVANLEEDWQAELWGKDAEAQARRDLRQAAFTAASRFAALARPD